MFLAATGPVRRACLGRPGAAKRREVIERVATGGSMASTSPASLPVAFPLLELTQPAAVSRLGFGRVHGLPRPSVTSRVRELKDQGMRPSDIAKALKIGRASYTGC